MSGGGEKEKGDTEEASTESLSKRQKKEFSLCAAFVSVPTLPLKAVGS